MFTAPCCKKYKNLIIVQLQVYTSVLFTDCVTNKSEHDKTNQLTCLPSDDSAQSGHLPSLIRIFAVHMKKTLGP